ncbi:hypothetical protein SK38_02448 [Citrobacter sp. MGH110]|nr:hypothetical protein SK38_02448 [Citrobacter sp. MGH110]
MTLIFRRIDIADKIGNIISCILFLRLKNNR